MPADEEMAPLASELASLCPRTAPISSSGLLVSPVIVPATFHQAELFLLLKKLLQPRVELW
jgi:hypothetical protein